MKKRCAMALALVMAFTMLTACSGASALEGTWKIVDATGEANEFEDFDIGQLFNSGLLEMTINFSDGIATLEVTILGETETETSPYTVKGNKITIDAIDIEELTYQIKGNTLTIDGLGGTLILERQKER